MEVYNIDILLAQLFTTGGNLVIQPDLFSGIFTQTDQDNVTKVPFLGDIPYLGNLFKTTAKIANKTELLIFITPKILTEGLKLD